MIHEILQTNKKKRFCREIHKFSKNLEATSKFEEPEGQR